MEYIMVLKVVILKILGNDLICTFIYGDEDKEGKFIFTLGSDSISIPQYLRDALRNIQS